MAVNNYMLVYKGKILDGYTIEDVKKNMAELVGKELWKLEFLFTGKKCVIKSNMGLREAMQYQGILALSGALTEVVYRSKEHQGPHQKTYQKAQEHSYGSQCHVMH